MERKKKKKNNNKKKITRGVFCICHLGTTAFVLLFKNPSLLLPSCSTALFPGAGNQVTTVFIAV